MTGRGERERPPKRRTSINYELEIATKRGRLKAHVTLGRYANGRLCEVFVSAARLGSDMSTSYGAWARSASRALQAGQAVEDLAQAVLDIRDDNAGLIVSPPSLEGEEASSLWDGLGRLLLKEGV